jgi:carboxypeptidase T
MFMDKKFFVTVFAYSKRDLINLREYDLDLFPQTSRVQEQQEFMIDGLLTLDEVRRLVEGGYRVLVKEESSKKARARGQTVGFQEWIKGMSEEE